MNHLTVVPCYHLGKWHEGRLKEGCWRISFFSLRTGETFRLVLWGRPNPAVTMGMKKGVKGQGRILGRRPEREREGPWQGLPVVSLRLLSPAPLEDRKKDGA